MNKEYILSFYIHIVIVDVIVVLLRPRRFVGRRPSSVNRRRPSSVNNRRSSSVVRRPSFVVRRPSFVVRRRPQKAKYSKYIGCESMHVFLVVIILGLTPGSNDSP